MRRSGVLEKRDFASVFGEFRVSEARIAAPPAIAMP
jgi:hypothetical protein